MHTVFRYVESETPPAPYALATLSGFSGERTNDVPVKLDSGADRTIVPVDWVDRLKLDEMERREFEGLSGERVTLSIVRLRIEIRGCRELVVDAAASQGESYILLGRDVINCFRIVLDGPNLRLEID